MPPADPHHELMRRAEALLSAARESEAEEMLRQVLLGDPRHVGALNALGAIALNRGDTAAALALFERGLRINARAAVLHVNAAETHRRLGAHEQAIQHAKAALALRPDHLGALAALASSHEAIGDDRAALAYYDHAIQLDPRNAGLLAGRAQILRRLGRLEDAAAAVSEALALQPDGFDVLLLAGGIEIDRQDPRKALRFIERALVLAPNLPEALALKGRALYDAGALRDSVEAYANAMAARPSLASGIGLGNALKDLGRFEEAQTAFSTCRQLDPDHFLACVNLVEVKRFKSNDDGDLRDMEGALARIGALPEEQQTYLHFALAKAYDDLTRFEDAGEHLLRGNALKRKTTEYSEKQTLALFQRIKLAFSATGFDRAALERGDAPIFVFGMPRSGTTLVEQILASHPDVAGAGETDHLTDTIAAAARANRAAFPEFVNQLSADALAKLGEDYSRRLRSSAPHGDRITDKAPYNFLFAGIIHLALPRARMIHTVRDPLDTCLSGFSKLFARGNAHSYDLGELGRYYRAYHDLMLHWRAVLPEDAILDVRYEDLVSAPETQARRILDFCGLAWDTRVLDFHRTDRAVKTWSAHQVRQPIYVSSVGRWRHYETRLAPLIEALGDLAAR